MCIRDSDYTAHVDHVLPLEDVEHGLPGGTLGLSVVGVAHRAVLNDVAPAVVPGIVVALFHLLDVGPGPVSYTHLDVYKRQQIGIAGLVAAVDVATANNTVAIVMTGSIAKDISEEYHIDPRRTASLLDIFASVMQGILPYGAQLLYAAAGAGVSAMQIVPYMFYCYLMAVSAILFILFFAKKSVISK